MAAMMRTPIIAVTLAFAVGRLLIEPRLELPTATGSYEAFVHLWVGGLYGAWWMGREVESQAARKHLAPFVDRPTRRSAYLFWTATAISALELIVFLIQKASA